MKYAFVSVDDMTIELEEGSGDNLWPEDSEEGYVDYINYAIFFSDEDEDGGMVMCTKMVADMTEEEFIRTGLGLAFEEIPEYKVLQYHD